MKSLQLTIRYDAIPEQELTGDDLRLVERAKAATQTSFSPYSHFRVGAAILLENGEIVSGSNQENASFTTGTCAERCAMFYANARYPDVAPVAIAIACYYGGSFTPEPGAPCGACRQVLSEVEHRYGRDLRVLLYGANHTYTFESMAELVPFQFNASNLE